MTDVNGLYYMRARYYHPELKRFLNRDTVRGNITDGQTFNRYAYVNGDPVRYVDPLGLSKDINPIGSPCKGNGSKIISSLDELPDEARSKITTSQQATLNLHERVYTHVTPEDLLGAEKELNGIPLVRRDGSLVLREDGLPFNHMQEVSDSYRGLEKLKKSYEGILKNPNLDSDLRQLYNSKINEVNTSMNKIEDIFNPFGGILPPK